jgi:hypothetical protein
MSSTELMNVSAFKGMAPAGAFAALNPQEESLADGIGSSYGVIGYKGKVWTLRHRGERFTFTRPDDGSPSAFLDVIILRSPNVKAKSYYPEGTYAAEGSEGKRPACASIDGITPDADSVERQAAACAICPRNEWKVNAEGHKGRECSDYKRLAVLVIPSLTARLLGAPLMEPVFLRVPAASLNDLAVFGEAMAKQGFHYSTFVTRVGFVADKSHPQMTFRALQPLTDAEAPVVMPMREESMAMRITGEDQIDKPRPQQIAAATVAAKPAVATSTATASALAASAQATAGAATSRSEPEKVDTGFTQPTVAQVVTPPASQQIIVPTQQVSKPEPTTVDTGFGMLGIAQPMVEVQPEQNNAAPKQTAADVGEAELSDDALDNAVANLLKTA